MARNPSWRTYRNRWNWHAKDIKRQAAEAVARLALRERIALAATVCPDADCSDPLCVAGRAAAMRGADWREVFAIVHPNA